MKELFYWVALIFVNLVQVMAQETSSQGTNRFTQSGDQKVMFRSPGSIEQSDLGDTSFHFTYDQTSFFCNPVRSSKSNYIKSLTTVSFFAPVCRVKRKAFVKVKGEGLKVGNRILGKSTYGALALTIQL